MNLKYKKIISIIIIIIIVIIIFIILFYKFITKDKFLSFRNNCKENHLKNMNKYAKNLFSDLPDSDEIAERLTAHFFIDQDDVVLEIGGNIGGVSSVIASKLKNGNNLVVLEPSVKALKELKNISEKYYNFNIYEGALVKKGQNIECKCTNNSTYADCKEVKYKVENNILFEDLEKKYNLKFNTLVIDCEGCYLDIFEDAVNRGWLKNINKILIEWDAKNLENLLFNQGFKLVYYLPHPNLEHGVKVYLRS